MSSIGLWTKAVFAAVTAGTSAALIALQDGHIEFWEWFTIFGAALVALAAVQAIKNASSGPLYYAKAGLAGLIALVGSLGTGLADGEGLTPNEIIVSVLALLAAIPVAIGANAIRSADQPLPGEPAEIQ